MERGAPFPHYQIPKSNSGLILEQQNNTNPTVTGSVVAAGEVDKNKSIVVQQQPCMAREQDQYMPIANVIRIMRKTLPPHAKISDEAKETIQECVSEYISFVTGEANERCQREQRKTITAEDILNAMSKLGFDDYVGPLNVFINRYREFETERGCSLRGESSSFKPAFGGNAIGFHAPPQGPPHGLTHGPPLPMGPPHFPPHGPPPHMGLPHFPPHGPPPPMGPYGYGMLDQSMIMGGGHGGWYYQNGSGQDGSGSSGGGATSSSTHGMPGFDPYSQYK